MGSSAPHRLEPISVRRARDPCPVLRGCPRRLPCDLASASADRARACKVCANSALPFEFACPIRWPPSEAHIFHKSLCPSYLCVCCDVESVCALEDSGIIRKSGGCLRPTPRHRPVSPQRVIRRLPFPKENVVSRDRTRRARILANPWCLCQSTGSYYGRGMLATSAAASARRRRAKSGGGKNSSKSDRRVDC